MNQLTCKIDAFWDLESEVWVATSEDVPGLATEAETLEALTQKLRSMVPELLQLNNIIPENQANTITLELTSRRRELVQAAA